MGNTAARFGLFGLMLAATAALSGPAFADAIGISTTDPALYPYTLPNGDFNVVALQFANVATGSNAYDIQSSPGQLLGDNAIVVGSGSGTGFFNGSPSNSPTIAGIDAPYATENGQSVSTFTTADPSNKVAPPQGNFLGDTTGTWNANVGALNTSLNNLAPVFYFNLNEQGSNDGLAATDLLLWAKVTVTTAAGAPVFYIDPRTGAIVQATFYVAGNPEDPNNNFAGGVLPTCGAGSGPAFIPGGQTGSCLWNNTNENAGVLQSIAMGAPDVTKTYPNPSTNPADSPNCLNPAFSSLGCVYDPNTLSTPQAEEWAYTYGNICTNGTVLVHFGSCAGGEGKTIQENLGANQAAYAAYSLDLNALLASLGDSSTDVLHIQWEMAAEDNGYEQLFILGSGQAISFVPEPVTISLFGVGLLGIGAIRRRKKA